jgi:hypothetical protein
MSPGRADCGQNAREQAAIRPESQFWFEDSLRWTRALCAQDVGP